MDKFMRSLMMNNTSNPRSMWSGSMFAEWSHQECMIAMYGIHTTCYNHSYKQFALTIIAPTMGGICPWVNR